jgi:hypothetical protein
MFEVIFETYLTVSKFRNVLQYSGRNDVNEPW